MIFICVKPHDILQVVQELKPVLTRRQMSLSLLQVRFNVEQLESIGAMLGRKGNPKYHKPGAVRSNSSNLWK